MNTQENGVFTIFQPMLNELIVFIAVATTAPPLSSSHVPRLSLIMLHPRVPPKGERYHKNLSLADANLLACDMMEKCI
jgi:hypothetical protein